MKMYKPTIYKLYALILFFHFSLPAQAKLAFVATGGTSQDSGTVSFAYSIYGYHKVDEQTLIGLHSGSQQGGIPILASLYVRLPLGGVILPVALGDIGYFHHDDNPGFLWKAGGGLDWKNGRYSSILILGGWEDGPNGAAVYSRIGVMIEF